jgi:hypothetical protein
MSRNFAIRLGCPRGDNDTWVTLANRDESVEQVLQQSWEFKCRQHGAQRGIPKEVLEMAPLDDPQTSKKSKRIAADPLPSNGAKKTPRSSARLSLRVPVTIYGFTGRNGAFHEDTQTVMVNSSGGLVTLKTKLALGETAFLVHKSSHQEQEVRVAYLDRYSGSEFRVGLAFKQPISNFWQKNRRRPRLAKSLRVLVKGTDAKGHPFVQSAYTVDLSQDGARLDSIGFLTAPGQTIQVRRRWRSATFRVVWIGQVGSREANQVGVVALQSDKDIWHVPLAESAAPAAPLPESKPNKKQTLTLFAHTSWK